MLLSVIIPAYNEERLLPQTLGRINHALEENRERGVSWEIIVCDNNSTDSTAAIAAQAGAKIAFEPINQIARARNTGADVARGDWLLFVDADSYPGPELVAELLDVVEDGNLIGCGTTVVVEGGTLFNKLRMERLNPLYRLLNWSGGALLMCQSSAFRAIGGFSTALYAYEEIEFVIRLKRYGRGRGKRFIVLHRHPVITSGRKGEYGIFSLGILFLSNFAAVLLFGLHYILPRAVVEKLGTKLLGYWYRIGR